MNFSRHSQRFIVRGMQLNKPVDLVDGAAGEYFFLKNLRSYVLGTVQQRPGETVINSTALADLIVHTIRRLNNDLPSAANPFARVVGAGTGLYVGTDYSTVGQRTARATGFDGNPLSLVPHRPDQSPEPFMYVGNASKMGKVKTDGTFQNMGIAPPVVEPVANKATNIPYNQIAWVAVAGGTAGALVTGATRYSTTIQRIVYDSGTTDWANIQPTAMTANIQPGSWIIRNGVAQAIIDSVYPGFPATTVAAIIYDSGTTGLCTVVLTTTPRRGLFPNALLLIDTEAVRVLSVTAGPDETFSFRCSTASAHSAGQTVTGLPSLRVDASVTTWAAGNGIDDQLTITATIGAGIGTISGGGGDLSYVSPPVGTQKRPAKDDDYIHFSIFCDDPTKVTEIKFMFDVDRTTNNFTQNYYFYAIQGSDLNTIADNSLTVLNTRLAKLKKRLTRAQRAGDLHKIERLQRNLDATQKLIEQQDSTRSDNVSRTDFPDSGQMSSGQSQWTEVKFRIGDLTRVGSDTTRDLSTVVNAQVQFNVTASVNIKIDSMYLIGSYGPDTGEIGTPYTYRYRYRSSTTGARSNPSPPTRSGVRPRREPVTLTPGAYSADAQVDKIDWFRRGGTLNEWIYIGTQPNSGSFTDMFADAAIQNYPRLEFDKFQPFPIADIPRTIVANVVGTAVQRVSGDTFNTSWGQGVDAIINSQPVTLFANPATTGFLQLYETLSNQTSVTMFIPEATILGQPMPALWGPFGEGEQGVRMFACGAPNEPGTLFWTNGNDPDSADEVNRLEITTPSEPLMNGCIFDGRAWVMSNERMFLIDVQPNIETGQALVRAQEIPNSKGLYARYGICVTPYGIAFIAADGIYLTSGGEPKSLTDGDLYPLFPHDGQAGATTNGIAPPNFVTPNSLRLEYSDGFLYFDFVDTGSNRRSLVMNMMVSGWQSYDVYGAPAVTHYSEEGRGVHSFLIGGNDGKLYQMTGTLDAGAAISSELKTGAFDAGDSRADKLWGDLIVDAFTNSQNVVAQLGFNNFATLAATQNVNTASRLQTILGINSGVGTEARNIGIDLTWTEPLVVLYEWQPSFLVRPENTTIRVTDDDDLGWPGPKFIQGISIEADTLNVAKALLIQGDNGASGVMTTQANTLSSITHNGRSRMEYSFAVPFIAHLVRVLPNDADQWKLYSWNWVWEMEPPLVTEYITQIMTNELQQFQHFRDAEIAFAGTADVTLTLVLDGTSYTYTLAHNSGVLIKRYFALRPVKFKTVSYRFTSSAGFRLYKNSCWIRGKPWGDNGAYQRFNPFGAPHAIGAALI